MRTTRQHMEVKKQGVIRQVQGDLWRYEAMND
jgi:hypothetical protein